MLFRAKGKRASCVQKPEIRGNAEQRHWFVFSRTLFGAMTLVASCYFVLAAFTMSYFGIGPLDLTEAVRQIVRWFPALYWVSVLAVITTLAPALRSSCRRLALGWMLLAVVAGAVLHVWGLKAAPGDYGSMIWALIVTFPAAWLGLMDMTTAMDRLPRATAASPNLALPTAAAAALVVSGTFAIRAAIMAGSAYGESPWRLATVALHGSVSTVAATVAVLAIITVAQRLVTRLGAGVLGGFALAGFAWWAIAAVVTRHIITPVLSFNQTYADLWAALWPLGFVLLLAGTNLAVCAAEGRDPASDALGLFRILRVHRGLDVVLAAGIVFIGVIGVGMVAPLDWQSVFQHLIAITVQLFVMLLVTSPSRGAWHRTRSVVAVALGCLTVVFSLPGITQSRDRSLGLHEEATASFYLGYEPLAESIQQLVRPPFRDAAAGHFAAFLRANSMITAPIAAPKFNIGSLSTPAKVRPDIYIIVADSLRRDFVAPYSADANTPAIAAFARDSVVFANAFTRFAGTALSEPGIWTGTALIEHQYPAPFAEMDALEKLTTADGYVRLLARDPVLDTLLQRRADDRPIGAGLKYWTDLTAECALGQIASELQSIREEQPIFAYVQPQDVHGVTLSLRRSRDAQFKKAPYLQQYRTGVSDIDRAFGQFIIELKRAGRYDNSVIILTSDHGDGVGDFGRWGHSESVLPDVVRVPLIVHLPAAMRAMNADTESVAMLTDIAPTLYYLLGHRPVMRHPLVGSPLFTETEAEQQQYVRDYEVIGNSYGPRFAVIDREAKTMFVADAVRGREAFFELEHDPHALRNIISVEEQQRGERRIRDHLDEVNRLYGYSPQAQ
jgi:hypothetical protein